MHLRVLLILLALGGLVLFFRWFMRTPAETIARHIRRTGIILAVGLLLYLAASGRLHWLFALVGSLLPFARKLLGLVQLIPLLRRFAAGAQAAGGNGGASSDRESGRATADGSGPMSRKEALEILGLPDDADRDAIIETHRRLIQKIHPDRGGSTYLASKLNEARDVLLESR